VIDSGVAIGNPFLQAVTKVELGRSWVYGSSPHEDFHGHGSGVASLAAYYTLGIAEGDLNQASAWIASARILTDDGQLDIPRHEDDAIDRHQQAWLFSNLLREIVLHYQPLGIRLFVLSFEMVGHIWSRATRRHIPRNAWTARTIDQLSREFDVVFCNITGNLSPAEALELSRELNAAYPAYLTSPLAKLLDPGPAALAVTSGSIAVSSHIVGGNHAPIAQPNQPSPFTRSGPGFGESIKPDFVEAGGSLVRHLDTGAFARNQGTDVVVASNSLTPALGHTHGTSFAAPRTAHHLALILRDALALGISPGNPLLRAFLALSTTAVQIPTGLDKDQALQLTGHGKPDGYRALLCQGHSAVLYWQGEIQSDTTAIFSLHVPAEIASVGNTKKRITVAVAASPLVQQWGVADYLGTELLFWLYKGHLDPEVITSQHQREEDEENLRPGATQDQFEGTLKTRRNVGTLQRDVFEWNIHRDEMSTHDYTLVVSLPVRAGWMKPTQIPLAIAVRLEETSGQFVQLYATVSARLRVKA
jgi:Subtilase family